MKLKQNLTLVSLALAMWCNGAASAEADKPWMDTHRPAAERAAGRPLSGYRDDISRRAPVRRPRLLQWAHGQLPEVHRDGSP